MGAREMTERRKTALALPESDPTPRRWEEIERERDTYLRRMLGSELDDWLEERQMSQLSVSELQDDVTCDAKCRPIWHWDPVSKLIRWIDDKPIWRTPTLDELEPDWGIQIAAARRYVDSHEPEVHDITPTWIGAIGVLLILMGLLGILTAWVKG